MKEIKNALVVRSVGGLFEVLLPDGTYTRTRARGVLRRGDGRVLVGDRVTVAEERGERVIAATLARKNALIRPPLANLDRMLVTLAVADPEPILETTDKLLAILEHESIAATVVLTKTDLSPARAEALAAIYRGAGYDVFLTSSQKGEGLEELREHLRAEMKGEKILAFAGASGVGKSSLLNALFPALSLEVGEISEKIGRGKNTTRHVALYPVFGDVADGFLADTPGFSMLDFLRFDFMKAEDLPHAFREFAPYLDKCRYTDCAHVKEEECAVKEALGRGELSPSRYETYCALYTLLLEKDPYGKEK
jgi:ribosome biogenesis GTPase